MHRCKGRCGPHETETTDTEMTHVVGTCGVEEPRSQSTTYTTEFPEREMVGEALEHDGVIHVVKIYGNVFGTRRMYDLLCITTSLGLLAGAWNVRHNFESPWVATIVVIASLCSVSFRTTRLARRHVHALFVADLVAAISSYAIGIVVLFPIMRMQTKALILLCAGLMTLSWGLESCSCHALAHVILALTLITMRPSLTSPYL